jgi:competence protein ComEA
MKLTTLAAAAALLFTSSLFAAPVNINKASADEISAALSGVGPSKAQAIVAYREQNGMFKNAGDIVQVKGIGSATYEQNKADIKIK